jgi:membrane protein implicated in regulation of membrane protease activity
VIEQVAEGRGMVKIGGELWQARPYDVTQTFETGTMVRVIEVKGATALVWRD